MSPPPGGRRPARSKPPRVGFLRDGLARNLRALVVGAGLLVGLWLLPDIPAPVGVQQPVQLAHGRIEAILPDSDDPTIADVRVFVLDGPLAGQELEAFLQGPAGQQDVPDYGVGDEVVLSLSEGPDTTFVAVSDRYRIPIFTLLLGIFAIAVVAISGWRGVRSLLALALTLGVVMKLVVPLVLAGWNPVLLAVGAGTAVTVVTILLTEGLRPASIAAIVGTFAALALTAVLAAVTNGLADFTAYQGSEAAIFLQSMGLFDLDLGGLFLAAVIFGALGVLDDVTMTQAATVDELVRSDPAASRTVLAGRAMNVGRSHIAATVNTLVLAYLGASLPLLVLFAAGGADPLLIASGEAVAVEIVRSLVGSMGIVAAVPLTTVVAVWLISWRTWSASAAEVRRGRG